MQSVEAKEYKNKMYIRKEGKDDIMSSKNYNKRRKKV